MEKLSEGFDILKAQGNGLSITDVITLEFPQNANLK